MARQVPGVRQELGTKSGRQIWMVTIAIAVLLLAVMLAFVLVRKYIAPAASPQVAPTSQPSR